MKELTSSKLWCAIVGLVTGIYEIVCEQYTEGTALIISSILGYLVAEGIVDYKEVHSSVDALKNAISMLVELNKEEEE